MIYTIGETVLDIIFKTFDNLRAKPGGSMLNTSVSLGRLGLKVSHVSAMATDKASDLLIAFLKENGVTTDFIYRNNQIKTSLALAHLNDSNNAEYTFYKDKLELQEALSFPKIQKGDLIHYGSFFSINPNIHFQIHNFLDSMAKNRAIKLYDPNFRKAHLPQLKQLSSMIENNFSKADIVKASDEDFENIFGIHSGAEAWNIMQQFNVKVLFYTKGENGSEVFSNQGSVSQETTKISVVSTVGAGDTYSAAIIYFLTKNYPETISLEDIPLEAWKACVTLAHEFAAQTCQSVDNYLSTEFCKTSSHV